jgi:hypothetical protein
MFLGLLIKCYEPAAARFHKILPLIVGVGSGRFSSTSLLHQFCTATAANQCAKAVPHCTDKFSEQS